MYALTSQILTNYQTVFTFSFSPDSDSEKTETWSLFDEINAYKKLCELSPTLPYPQSGEMCHIR